MKTTLEIREEIEKFEEKIEALKDLIVKIQTDKVDKLSAIKDLHILLPHLYQQSIDEVDSRATIDEIVEDGLIRVSDLIRCMEVGEISVIEK